MSIKPIDHNVMIPKTQEVANAKQTENLKNRNIIESQFVQQKKTVKNNSRKVLNTEKTIYNKIKEEGNAQKEKQSKSDKKKENKDDKLIVEKINDLNRGKSIDIRI